MRNLVGADIYNGCLAELASEFDIDKDVCLKFPASAAEALRRFTKHSVTFPQFDEILTRVDALAMSGFTLPSAG